MNDPYVKEVKLQKHRLRIGVNKTEPTLQPIDNERGESAQFLCGWCLAKHEVVERIIMNPMLLDHISEMRLSFRQYPREMGDIVSEHFHVSSSKQYPVHNSMDVAEPGAWRRGRLKVRALTNGNVILDGFTEC